MTPSPGFLDELKTGLAGLTPLWVGGLAVLQIYVLSWSLPLQGETYEWAQFLLLGTLFPILVLLLRLSPLSHPILAAACVLPVPLFSGTDFHWVLCTALALGQIILLLSELRLQLGSEGVGRVFPIRGFGGAAALVVAFLSWAVASHWVWWTPFPSWITLSPYFLGVLLGALLLTTLAVVGLCIPAERGSGRFGWVANVPALAVFALLSTHVYHTGLRDEGVGMGRAAFHHWGAITESADLVRQGAWPLWEIPTQYGFLNTLLVAALPFASVWQSLYVVNAILLTLSASILFWLLRSLRPGPIHYVFSLLVAAAAVFLLPGEPVPLTGPFPYPSVGAFRFIWCYVLLGVLAWDYDALYHGGLSSPWTSWLGTLAWLAGTLWSAESAIFCTTIWVPAYTLLALRQCGLSRKLIDWLVLPPLMLGTAIAIVCGIYVFGLGHPPDARCFLEYCLVVDFFAQPIEPAGAVGVLLLAYIIIATMGAYCLSETDPLESLPLVVGAAAALWAVSSYFVGRSHNNNVINLAPLIMASLAAALRVLDRVRPNELWSVWIKVSLTPVFTVLLAIPFLNRDTLEQYVLDTAKGYRQDMTLLLPDADPALQDLLTQAGVEADTPIAFFDNEGVKSSRCPCWRPNSAERPVDTTRAWLPASSTVLYGPLSAERGHVYFSRFVARAQRSGWLIRPTMEPTQELAWVLSEVKRTHTPGRTLSNARWMMTWFEYDPKK